MKIQSRFVEQPPETVRISELGQLNHMGSAKNEPARPQTQGQNRVHSYEIQMSNIQVIGGIASHMTSIEGSNSPHNVFLTGVAGQENQAEPDQFGEKMIAAQVDKFKIIAVVDSKETFSSSDCIFVNNEKNEVSHVCVNQLTKFKFDELVSSYDQVYKIGHSLAYSFTKQRLSNKVVLNLVNQSNSNNNCGFNLANFKPYFIDNYFEDVVKDYERSFIGAFSLALIEQFLATSSLDLYLSISKFVGNMGFSLTQNNSDVVLGFQNDEERNVKLAQIMNQGAIPEFVRIRDINEIYKIFTEVNAKNKQIPEVATQFGSEQPSDSQLDLQNIKEDLILLQFKLVRQDTLQTWNTLTFINLPQSKVADVNMVTISEVITKQKRDFKQNFMPYNKSILTRVIYDQLKENNILAIGHFSKAALVKALKRPVTGYLGPAKGIFNMLSRFGFDQSMQKQKITSQQALNLLEQNFKQDILGIYGEIGKFREGLRSFEAYTQSQSQVKDGGKTMTMFHQMLYFLTLKDDMKNDAIDHFAKGGFRQDFPSLLSDDQVQSVIFDDHYVNYLKAKQQFGGEISNISAGPNSGAATSKIEQLKQGKMKHFQYECIKSELKEEYERKVNQQNRRFNEQAQIDPNYMLMGSLDQPEFPVMHLRVGKSKQTTRLDGDRDQQFQFYLDNAQKAINLMRSKYKPNVGSVTVSQEVEFPPTKIYDLPKSQSKFYRPQIEKVDTHQMKVQRAISMNGTRTKVVLRAELNSQANDDFALEKPMSVKSTQFATGRKSQAQRFKFTGLKQPEFTSLQPPSGLKSMSGIESVAKDQQIKVDDQLNQNFLSQQQLNPLKNVPSIIKQKNFNNYQSLRSQGVLRHFQVTRKSTLAPEFNTRLRDAEFLNMKSQIQSHDRI